MTSKWKGTVAEFKALICFLEAGINVFQPAMENTGTDLVIDFNDALYRVQVKSSRCKTKYNNYQVNLKTFGGNRSGQTIKKINSKVDFVFICIPEGMYLIPKKMFLNKSTINCGSFLDEYKVSNDICSLIQKCVSGNSSNSVEPL